VCITSAHTFASFVRPQVATSIDDKLRVCSAANAVLGDAPVATGGFPSSLASSKRNPDLAVLGVSQGKLVVLRKGNKFIDLVYFITVL